VKIHWDLEQRSDEWMALRAGRLTASEVDKVVTPTGGAAAPASTQYGRILARKHGLQDEVSKLARELDMKDPYFDFDNLWMARGRKLENEALAWFKIETGLEVTPCGFVEHGPFTGFSPDGLIVGKQAHMAETITPVQVKCPAPETHIGWLHEGVMPKKHAAQVHAEMYMSGAPNAYFMSYCPDVEPLLLKVLKGPLTEKVGQAIENAIDALGRLEREHFTV
jgi:putative phage-type endonuclease